jgi:hypothetical protein
VSLNNTSRHKICGCTRSNGPACIHNPATPTVPRGIEPPPSPGSACRKPGWRHNSRSHAQRPPFRLSHARQPPLVFRRGHRYPRPRYRHQHHRFHPRQRRTLQARARDGRGPAGHRLPVQPEGIARARVFCRGWGGGRPVVLLLGYGTWQRRYAGVSDILGRTVRLNPADAVCFRPRASPGRSRTSHGPAAPA